MLIKNKKIHTSWRGIKFTQKGKKIGISESWERYENFYNDVSGTWFEGSVLSRFDKTAPFSRENFEWIRREDQSKFRRVKLEYNGETRTLEEWANHLHVSYMGLRLRYHRGKDPKKHKYTTEEILFGKIQNKKRQIKTQEGMDVQTKRIKASKMISSYRITDKKKGFVCDITIDFMVNHIFTKTCVYCGSSNRIGCDRIDNNLGHVMTNCVSCCYGCNTARGDRFSHKEMFIIGRAISEVNKLREIT